MAVKLDSSEEVIETEGRIAKANEEPILLDSLCAHLEGERLVLASETQNAKHGLRYFLLAHHLEPANPLYAADLALSLYECGRHDEARRAALSILALNRLDAQKPALMTGHEAVIPVRNLFNMDSKIMPNFLVTYSRHIW